jgi:Icc-related predicted phosphoesterase
VRILAISDTHGKHAALTLPEADVLIHAGDVSSMGKREEISSFLEWFSALSFSYKIFIAGNHDFFFERNSAAEIYRLIPDNVIYLNDSGITIDGIEIWGSPITPWFYDWAFNRQRGADIRTHWDMIPATTDMLITHGPPAGILDRTTGGQEAGCADLLQKVKLVKPAFHIFGHIHEGYGLQEEDGTAYINASVVDEKYRIRNNPVIFELTK